MDNPLVVDLSARLRRRGLARVADAILQVAQPAIRLDCHRVDEATLPVGASKLGGLPDLPHEVAWPQWRGGPLPFIAQIRLDDLAPYDLERELPPSGLLSFFYTPYDEAGELAVSTEPATWSVPFFPGDRSRLARRSAPNTLGKEVRFPACAMTYTCRPTLPDVDSHEILALAFTHDERNAYIDVALGADVDYLPEMDHRLLGYPYNLDGSTLLECSLAVHNPPKGEEAATEDWLALQHRAEAEWRLLLQVYSNTEAEMDWAGGGVVHFCLPRAALSVGDFSRVWVNLQSV